MSQFELRHYTGRWWIPDLWIIGTDGRDAPKADKRSLPQLSPRSVTSSIMRKTHSDEDVSRLAQDLAPLFRPGSSGCERSL